MAASQASGRAHRALVAHVTKHLKKRFYQDIRARDGVEGFPPPAGIQVNGTSHVPDVTTWARKDRPFIFDVATREKLDHPDTRHRWAAFHEHAARQDGTVWVVVPKTVRVAAEERLQSWQVNARMWEV